jgi:hypothetical protein
MMIALFSDLATWNAATHEDKQHGSRAATDRTQGFQFANIYIAWAKVMYSTCDRWYS